MHCSKDRSSDCCSLWSLILSHPAQARLGFASLAHLAVEPYDEAKDFVPAQGDGDYLLVREGCFAIFGPHDAHMPSLHPGARPHPVRKVVVKVAV